MFLGHPTYLRAHNNMDLRIRIKALLQIYIELWHVDEIPFKGRAGKGNAEMMEDLVSKLLLECQYATPLISCWG